MSPVAASVLAPDIIWDHETLWPAKPSTPTAAGTATGMTVTVSDSTFGWQTQHVVTQTVAGTQTQMAVANRWCLRLSTLADTSTSCMLRRFLQWCPYLDRATVPIDGGDPASRVGWLRFDVVAGLDAAAGPTVDALGVSIAADNGQTSGFPPTTWLASLGGGFGIFKRAGTSLWRYASYSAAPALLEAIDLPSADGWHTADFIIRQARRDDAATPWLTFLWDGVPVFSERAFGHAMLPAPATLRAGAHGWCFFLGEHLTTGALSVSMQCRMGGRFPNGTAVPP